MFLGGNYDGKPEESCLGVKMVVGSSDNCFGESGEGYSLVQPLGSEDGSELGSPGGRFSGKDPEGLKICAPGCVPNGDSCGNLG